MGPETGTVKILFDRKQRAGRQITTDCLNNRKLIEALGRAQDVPNFGLLVHWKVGKTSALKVSQTKIGGPPRTTSAHVEHQRYPQPVSNRYAPRNVVATKFVIQSIRKSCHGGVCCPP